jgi:hypothetical protein
MSILLPLGLCQPGRPHHLPSLHNYTVCSFTVRFSRIILLRSAQGSKCVSIMVFETSYAVCVSSDIDVLGRTKVVKRVWNSGSGECQDYGLRGFEPIFFGWWVPTFSRTCCLNFLFWFHILLQLLHGGNKEMYEKDRRGLRADIRILGLSNTRQQCYPRDVFDS